jgi:hypothetical protein
MRGLILLGLYFTAMAGYDPRQDFLISSALAPRLNNAGHQCVLISEFSKTESLPPKAFSAK